MFEVTTVAEFNEVFNADTKEVVFVTENQELANDVTVALNTGVSMDDVIERYDTEGFPEIQRLINSGKILK